MHLVNLLLCWALPMIATIFSSQRADKWIVYWILTMLVGALLMPILEYIFAELTITFIQLTISLLMIMMLSPERVTN